METGRNAAILAHTRENSILVDRKRLFRAPTTTSVVNGLYGRRQEIRAQKTTENRRRTEMVRKQREEARLKKEAEQRAREAKLQEEQRRRISFEKKKVSNAWACVIYVTVNTLPRKARVEI